MHKFIAHLLFLSLISACSNGQDIKMESTRLVGGPCEGCEAVLEFGDQKLDAVDTLPDFHEGGQKIKVSGTIYQSDGEHPAQDVIVYFHHTNQKGIYATKGNETGWGKRHGYNRGWIKTDEDGKYTIYTIKPGAYPSGTLPAHIHATLLEPNGKYYYIDEYHFKGDSLLSQEQAHPPSPRGGHSGLLDLKKKGDLWVGHRDIILGKNVPDYQ